VLSIVPRHESPDLSQFETAHISREISRISVLDLRADAKLRLKLSADHFRNADYARGSKASRHNLCHNDPLQPKPLRAPPSIARHRGVNNGNHTVRSGANYDKKYSNGTRACVTVSRRRNDGGGAVFKGGSADW